jgi:hypothetical protein
VRPGCSRLPPAVGTHRWRARSQLVSTVSRRPMLLYMEKARRGTSLLK